ncbi:MAG: hypothetical protein WBN07_13630 [Woeseiaceae bacterium]|jgi:hypothetical protein
MRLYPIAILVGLSACASAPSGNDVDTRVASWHGAPAADLVAVLGEPEITKRGSWIWQFPGPDDGEVIAYGSANAGAALRPVSGSEGGPSDSARMPGETRVTQASAGTFHKHVVCKYIGYVENGTVTQLTTLSKPGTHCRFDELPLRSN